MEKQKPSGLAELFKGLREGTLKAHSELGTRDEAKQSRNFGPRYTKLKPAVGISARALVMKDFACGFNPFTCEEDDSYNAGQKFRPILLVSEVIEMIKQACKEDDNLAEKWNQKLAILPGVIDWSAPFVHSDYLHFKHAGYIFTRVTSYSTVNLSFGGECGFPEFSRKYTVDPTQLNEQGSYDYETAPIWHKAQRFFMSMLRPEADEAEIALKASGATKQSIQDQRRTIFGHSPVGAVSPTNHVAFLMFPLDQPPAITSPDDFKGIEKAMHFMNKVNDKWSAVLAEIYDKDNLDENADFFDLSIKTISDKATKDGKVYTDEDVLELFKLMTVTVTDGRLSMVTGKTTIPGRGDVPNSELFAPVLQAAKAYFEHSQEESAIDGDTFEKIMAQSSGYRPIETVMPNFLMACNKVFVNMFATSKHFTDTVKKANAEFLTAMNPDNALALAAVDDDELEEAQKAQEVDLAKIQADLAAASASSAAVDATELVEMAVEAD